MGHLFALIAQRFDSDTLLYAQKVDRRSTSLKAVCARLKQNAAGCVAKKSAPFGFWVSARGGKKLSISCLDTSVILQRLTSF